jgi:Caspase domain
MSTMNKLWTVVFLLFLNSLQAQQPGLRRIAYLIGNSVYADGNVLYNSVNDARDFGKSLSDLGFEVHQFENVNRADFQNLLKLYGKALNEDAEHTVGLFFYAGHGMQIEGRNFLMPTDAIEFDDEEEAEAVCITLDSVMATLQTANNKMNIIVLDACRNNPFLGMGHIKTQRDSLEGLAAIEAPVGTLIAYSTAPGRVAMDGAGLNGVYTQELIKAIHIPDLTIEQVFKKVRTQVKEITDGEQIPWENSSLESEFYFKRNPQVTITSKGVYLASANENLPLPERYARDMCGCMTGLVTMVEKIDNMPKDMPAEVAKRLAQDKETAIEQSERCIKNATKDYLKNVTPEIDQQTLSALEQLCPKVHHFMMARQ